MAKLIGAVVMLVVLMLAAAPTVNAQSTVIKACVNASDGTMRIVPASTTACKKNENLLSWPSVNTLGNLNCTQGQVPVRSGSSTWVCGNITDDDTLGDLTCTAGQTVKWSGTAWVCDPPRFELKTHTGSVQTVFDNQTGLEWEIKVICGAENLSNPRCVENTYSWSTSSPAPDGTLFTDFLPKLNNSISESGDPNSLAGCYAGHCDWRIPNIAELRSFWTFCSTAGTCFDPIFQPNAGGRYWSSTSNPPSPQAWGIQFLPGGSWEPFTKTGLHYTRAVRGSR